MASDLDDVKQLLNLGIGDIGRLEHIKQAIEKNKTLYTSDKEYLKKLIHNLSTEQIKSNPNNLLKKSIIEETPKKISLAKINLDSNTNSVQSLKKGSSKKKKIIITIVIIIVFIAFLVFSGSSDIGKQQFLDRLQEKSNHCNTLPSSASESLVDTLESPRAKCAFELMPEVITFCEKYPNDDILNGNCADFLDARDKLKNLASYLNSRFP